MSKSKLPSDSLVMKIDRQQKILQIQWNRKPENIVSVLQKLSLFGITETIEIKNQIIDLTAIKGKKTNNDIIFI